MSSTGEIITLRDGRRAMVHRLGAEAGRRVVVFCHPAPGAGAFDPDPAATRAAGVTLLALDRPGYGRSDPATGWADVPSAADDLAELLDQRGLGPVPVVGWSAGGRVALALAARRPELVRRLAVLATPAPDEEVPWVDPGQREQLAALRGQPVEQVRDRLDAELAGLVPADPQDPQALRTLLGAGPADEAALATPGAARQFADLLATAFAQGARGLVDEIAGYVLRPWGFTPDQVRAATLLLYGADDALAGPEHGRWWRDALPDARLEVVPDAGHLLVVPSWARVLDYLVGPPTRATSAREAVAYILRAP
ncbi:Pimeloyl-[acyl-carrier protein] methyl ester esterase [Micromonospora sp. MW-13]|uniref:alpha/beta fold hydrolase n=1 Tax=unclassified Micromonospora TaxID=2617518 RepID=UPI000E44C7F2|nr:MULTISPECIES: alpha/beta hydrolase [unclassified Micromonospora]MCX4472919.1 alpha/beta hydrolase [Micromonospora sp. NBC_01655]RGC69112.1 Pimeloyl-[acyl-carrier protein] methyl ester esterase [Micromonospora sp. MW-13]